jgi:ADP-ribose pyrophosphatase YjhB (NUDIX family)
MYQIMIDLTSPGSIRAKVICVFRNGNRILVIDAFDPAEKTRFHVPAGGGIEFGETSEVALRREIREEFEAEIEVPRLLGVLENVFTYNNQEGHEIVFVYDAKFTERAMYGRNPIEGRESNGENIIAIWLDLDVVVLEATPLYPDGLLELLKKDCDANDTI